MSEYWSMARAREPEAGNRLGSRIVRVGMGLLTFAGMTQLGGCTDQRSMEIYPFFHTPTKEQKKLSVLTWNIHMGQALDGSSNIAGVLKLLKKEKPDVICLQEMPNSSELLGLPGYTKAFSTAYINPWNGKKIGNGIFTKLPFQHAHEEILGGTIERPMRTAVSMEVTLNKRNMNVSTAHLESINSRMRLGQSHNLVEFMKQEQTKILCGDMNENVKQPVHEYLQKNGYVSSECTEYDKRMVIDVIMVQANANLTENKCKFIETKLSDHPVLISEFTT